MAKANKCFIVPLVIGLIVLLVGILMVTVIFPNLIEKEVVSNVELKDGTLQWYRFREIPFPFNFNVYLFAITNKDEVLAGKKPQVREVGPFVYKEHRKKVIHGIEDDQIVYSDSLTYVFNQTESGEISEDDPITVLNSPVTAILQSLETLPISLGINIEDVLKDIFQDTNVFMEVKVKDLTFGGIRMCDPARNPSGVAKLVCLVIMLMNQKLLEYHEDLSMSFSLFKYKTKLDGPFTINSGVKNVDNLGSITSYKGQEYTQFWEGEKSQCDKVNGFYTTFPPFMEENSNYPVYSTDICK
ncbi:hypothetical protein RN001_014764 [Aquatica leii]|uniref:Sensory neuron membrane protein 2 n=1 Tax=Aquatica leii TaxID=1421715 RepID=A0AAN7PYT1_9COLE|nr:hypothetical protein RN001_014764 [Aquatica leii]